MILSGETRLAGVIGWPVKQSLSPRLHGYWLEAYRIDGAYVPLPVRPADIQSVLKCLPKMGFRGANVTVPHKEVTAASIDQLDETARAVKAVNTVVVSESGRLLGRNTDVEGFLGNLDEGVPGWRAQTERAVVLGAGGAARAVVHGLLAAKVEEIAVCNRTETRARALVDDFGRRVKVLPWRDRSTGLTDAQLLVNTTSLGMTGQDALEIALDRLPASAVVNDVVYKPLETQLLQSARRQGLRSVDGIGMLLHQAKAGFEAWFGVKPDVDASLRAFILQDVAAP